MTPAYIVDAHHHLWDIGAVNYTWLRQRGIVRFFGDPTPIQKNYGVAQFRSDHAEFAIGKSVHVQVGTAAGAELDETRWLQTQADEHGLPSAIVAYCDLSSRRAPAVIEAHLRRSPRVRGIRQIVSRHPREDAADRSPQLLLNPIVADNLTLLASLGLSFDLQLTPPNMIAAAQLLGRIDGLRVALCHAGSPWRRDAAGLAEWCAGLKALADIPGVMCKLSGFGMFDPAWTPLNLKPLIMTVLEIFGADRVMWGSNFPVDKLYRSYDELISVMFSIVPGELHDDVFRATAERFYRI
jgi:predicted TIM-barrel fold metal-dependent hydrolase